MKSKLKFSHLLGILGKIQANSKFSIFACLQNFKLAHLTKTNYGENLYNFGINFQCLMALVFNLSQQNIFRSITILQQIHKVILHVSDDFSIWQTYGIFKSSFPKIISCKLSKNYILQIIQKLYPTNYPKIIS